MNLTQELFTFPFRDEQWRKKLGIGVLVSIGSIAIIPMFGLVGYGLRALEETLKAGEPVLPGWENFGELIVLGLKYTAVGLVYIIPIYLLFIPGTVLSFMAEGNEELIGTAIITQSVISLCIVPLSLVFSYFIMVAVTHMMAEGGRLGAAFEFQEVWKLSTEHLRFFMLAFFMYTAASMVLSIPALLISLTIILAPVAFGVYAVLVQAYLGVFYGLAYRAAFPDTGKQIGA